VSLLADLLSFLRRPWFEVGEDGVESLKFKVERGKIKEGRGRNYSFGWKLLQSGRLWCVGITLSLLSSMLITLTFSLLQQSKTNAVGQLIENQDMWLSLLIIAVVAPFIEEITFRLWHNPKPLFLAAGLSFLGYYTFSFVTSLWFPDFHLPVRGVVAVAVIATCLLLSIGILFTLFRLARIRAVVTAFFAQHFRLIFWFTTCYFALIHSTNYESIGSVWFVIPLLISPQLVLGTLIGFCRNRYGYWWGVAFHSFNNTILVLPILLLQWVIPTFGSDGGMQASELNVWQQLVMVGVGLGMLTLLGIIVAVNIHLMIEFILYRRRLSRKS
jgi:hypothetical protein